MLSTSSPTEQTTQERLPVAKIHTDNHTMDLRKRRVRAFFSYYKPYLGLFVADMACALIVSAITLLLPLCTLFLTKNILEGNDPHALRDICWMGALMLALVGLQVLCTLFIDFQGHMMGTYMESDMRRELFEHYQKLSLRFYDAERTGQLMTRISNDTFAMSELYHHGPEDIVITSLTMLGTFFILLKINVALTLITFAVLPFSAIYVVHFSKKMQLALLKSKDRIGDINAQVEDTLAGIRVVKSFTNEEIETNKFAEANQRFVSSRRDGYQSESALYGGMLASTQLITIAVVICGSLALLHAALDLADFVTYLLCIGILVEPLQKLVNFMRLYQEGITGFQRFMEALAVEPDMQDAPHAVELKQVQGAVEFQHVSFSYHDQQRLIIKDLSLSIQAGEYVAIVGTSGAGKTTLCSLIPRFYDVSAGCILLDGQDIRHVTQRSLRAQIGIVQQDTYLFAGSVAENIGYGKRQASRAEIIAAAQKAHAHDFIMALPHGYDTDIGQRGVRLSGGQKQRLSIARVFLKNPPILIFDEATSALDNASEQAVQDSLEQLAELRTTLVIAHRLSTIRKARRIVVLAEGEIREQGTHEELLALGGIYANLYHMQATI